MKARVPTEKDRTEAMIKQYFPDMQEADVRAWIRTTKWRLKENEAMANVMLISMLFYLMTEEHYGAIKLHRAWEGMIRLRAEARKAMRQQDGAYTLEHTGRNVEDFYMREELRKKGCDVLEWEQGVTMDENDEVHFAPRDK